MINYRRYWIWLLILIPITFILSFWFNFINLIEHINYPITIKPISDSNLSFQRRLDNKLVKAIYSEDYNKVRMLIKQGANVNKISTYGIHDSPIHCTRNIEMAKILLNADANINAKNGYGETALFISSKYASPDYVNFLIERGASVKINDNYDSTPLHAAAGGNNRKNIMIILLKKGVDINSKNSEGNTALHQSIFANRIDNAKALLELGAYINAKNNEGFTPLLLAISFDNVSFVRLFINKGADIKQKNEFGKDAWNIAKENKSYGALRILENKNLYK